MNNGWVEHSSGTNQRYGQALKSVFLLLMLIVVQTERAFSRIIVDVRNVEILPEGKSAQSGII